MGNLIANILSISVFVMAYLSISGLNTHFKRMTAMGLMVCAVSCSILLGVTQLDIDEMVKGRLYFCVVCSLFVEVYINWPEEAFSMHRVICYATLALALLLASQIVAFV